MQTIELTDGGILLYEEPFLPPDIAERHVHRAGVFVGHAFVTVGGR